MMEILPSRSAEDSNETRHEEFVQRIWEILVTEPLRCIAIGVHNKMTEDPLVNPRWWLLHGTVGTKPDIINVESSSISVFKKWPFSLRGTAGILCFNIGDSGLRLCILWQLHYWWYSEDIFSVFVVHSDESEKALFEMNVHCATKRESPDLLWKQDSKLGIDYKAKMVEMDYGRVALVCSVRNFED